MLQASALSAALRSCFASPIWLTAAPEEASERPARRVEARPLLSPYRREQVKQMRALAEELRRDGLLAEALTLFQLAKRLTREA
ncbi:MAG: hypothetical protein FJX68_03280 [Alphaproteobacteria bacterium]|nr:hypothetical protein [Alphaproteobacteria bacterium]